MLLRALIACGSTAVFDADVARVYLAEALELARAVDDSWRLSQVLWWQAFAEIVAGEPGAALEAGTEGYRLADEIGDRFVSRMCRFWGLGSALMVQGEPVAGAAQFRKLVAEAEAAHDPFGQFVALSHLAHTLAYQGDTDAAPRPRLPLPNWVQSSGASPRALVMPAGSGCARFGRRRGGHRGR